MTRIARNSITLYRKTMDYTEIHIRIGKRGKITTYWRPRNKETMRKANKVKVDRGKQLLHNLKINGCAICGYNKCDAALDFHHVNPENKKFGFGTCSLYVSNEKIVEELGKCVLLCCRCHREIHYKEKSKC